MKVRARYFVALAVIILSQVVSLFGATAAYADKLNGPYIDTKIVDGIKQWDYRDAIVSCFAQGAQRSGGGLYTLSLDELNSGKWFHDKSERVSYYSDPSDGTWTCKEDISNQLSTILKALGWDTPLAAACELGYKQLNIPTDKGVINDNAAASLAASLYTESGFDLSSYDKDRIGELTTPACGTSLGGDSSYIYLGAPYANETNIANISKAVDTVRKSTNNLSDAQQYAAGWEALRLSCKLTTGSGDGLYEVKGPTNTELIDGSGAASTTNKVNISVVNQDGSISYVLFPVDSPKSSIDIAPRPGYENQGWGINFNSCDSLAAFVNQKAAAYQTAIVQLIQSGELGGGYTGTPSGSGAESQTTCAIEMVGWLVCPAAHFVSWIADGSMGILNKSFEVQANKLFDTSSSNQAYVAWQQIRNYANILFVVAFLIIIFSQITSIGITNYGIKKLLPKLIATAVLVNVSFPICALLVDVSNLLGYGLATFLGSAITVDTGSANDIVKQGNVFTGIVTTLLAGAITGAFFYFSFAAVIGLVISAVIIGVTMVVLLGVRQALIVLLVVLAPLAFVAMLLPNTNSLFKKWKKMLQDMLLVFPIASLLYGAGKLADQVLTATSDDWIVQTLAAALPILSLVGVYQLFKKAMTGLEGLGGAIGNLNNGIGKGGKALRGASDKAVENSRYGQFRKYRQEEAQRRRGLIQAGAYDGGGPRGWLSKVNGAFNRSKLSGKFGDRSAAKGIAASQKIGQEEVDNEALRMMNGVGSEEQIGVAQREYEAALESGDTVRARAAQKILLSKGGLGVSKIRESIQKAEQSGRLHSASATAVKKDLASAGLKGKDAALDKWSYTKDSLDSLTKSKDTHSKLTDSELSTQSKDSLTAARDNGSLGAETAARILGNDNLANNLTAETRALLEGLAGSVVSSQGQVAPTGTAPQSQTPSGQASQPAQPQTTTHGGTTYEQTESGLFIPRN